MTLDSASRKLSRHTYAEALCALTLEDAIRQEELLDLLKSGHISPDEFQANLSEHSQEFKNKLFAIKECA